MDGLRREYRGQLNVLYVSMDQDEGRTTAGSYGVIGTPTLLLLDRSGNQVQVLRGVIAEPQIRQAVEDLIAADGAD